MSTETTSGKQRVVTFGSFDGVHLGHQEIFQHMQRIAEEIDGETVVVFFDPHPKTVIYPHDDTVALLTTAEEKKARILACGIDKVIIKEFTIEFSQLSPSEYVDRFIINEINPAVVVIGYDHRFGRNRNGDIRLLKAYEREGAFKVVEIAQQFIEQNKISSTEIRKALSQGALKKASLLLGCNYTFVGRVIHGRKIGQKLGYRTANLELVHDYKLLPGTGIYAAYVSYDEFRYEAMLYIGTRPTFKDDSSLAVEVHLFNFNQIVYGQELAVELVAYIRDDMSFDSLEGLKLRMDQDKAETMAIFDQLNVVNE